MSVASPRPAGLPARATMASSPTRRRQPARPASVSTAIHASLLDRSLANIVLDSNFDDGKTDAATETIKIDRNRGDLVLGREATVTSWLGGSWHAGLRVASINVDRDVLYQSITGGVSKSADIALKSDMIGLGPDRRHRHDNRSLGHRLRFEEHGVGLAAGEPLQSHSHRRLPIGGDHRHAQRRYDHLRRRADVRHLDRARLVVRQFYAGIGYTVSAALNGGRTILSSGNDDVDGATSPYTTEGNDSSTRASLPGPARPSAAINRRSTFAVTPPPGRLPTIVERGDDVLGQRVGERRAFVRLADQPDAAAGSSGKPSAGLSTRMPGAARTPEHRTASPASTAEATALAFELV